jgi:hypothetical protein
MRSGGRANACAFLPLGDARLQEPRNHSHRAARQRSVAEFDPRLPNSCEARAHRPALAYEPVPDWEVTVHPPPPAPETSAQASRALEVAKQIGGLQSREQLHEPCYEAGSTSLVAGPKSRSVVTVKVLVKEV